MFDVVTDLPKSEERDIHINTLGGWMTIATAPASGSFAAAAVVPPARLTEGAVIGHIERIDGQAVPVGTPAAGNLRDLLAQPGQMVGIGQGLAYLERVAPLGRHGMV